MTTLSGADRYEILKELGEGTFGRQSVSYTAVLGSISSLVKFLTLLVLFSEIRGGVQGKG